MFVVGDEKQSIYSFQGADLGSYRAWRERLRRRAADRLAEVAIDLSFRSTPAVLDCVDAVFASGAAKAGVIDLDARLRHAPFRRNHAGLVEVWPLLEPPPSTDDDEPWPLPDVPRFALTAQQSLAQTIAGRVRTWLEERELLESEGRPVRAGDILILLDRRGVLQELLIRALRREGLPVAGADRLTLTGHIAVQDLLALGRVALLPEDDLSLAALLKSPLFGLDEEALFALADGRGRLSLLERLRASAESDAGVHDGAYTRLGEWLRRADFMPPFEFFASVLNEADTDGRTTRERLLARLGPEAIEPIEAFLGQALAYEEGHPASLQGFMRWMEVGSSEIKRDAEQAGDAIRVMTVHGSKGLEAPIVILADTGPHRDPRPPRLIWDESSGLPFWRGRQSERDARTEELCELERIRNGDERRRLLYVALTRARDRLYIAGCGPSRSRDGGPLSWHDHVVEGLAALADVSDLQLERPFAGPGRRYRRGVPTAAAAAPPAFDAPTVPVPAWAREPVTEEGLTRSPLAPSRLAEPEPAGAREGREHEAVASGLLVHRLLELLPGLPETDRAPALQRFLARRAKGLDELARERVASATWRILAHPELLAVFGPDARAEQAITGTLGDSRVSGQVDRLLVGEREVIAVDFKTNRRPPTSPETTPLSYRRQMAVYARLLQDAYPERTVRCALVWTETGEVMWMPSALLARTLAELPAP